MKKITALGVAAFCLALCAASCAAECPRWISVMPMNGVFEEEIAADAADLGNTTFVDGILWSCAVNPGGDPPSDKGAMFAKRWRKSFFGWFSLPKPHLRHRW